MAHRGTFPPQPRVPRSPVTVPRCFCAWSEPCSFCGAWGAPVTWAGEELGLEELGLQELRAEECVASPGVSAGGV